MAFSLKKKLGGVMKCLVCIESILILILDWNDFILNSCMNIFKIVMKLKKILNLLSTLSIWL